MSAIFVTATGTDIGKTFVIAGLIRALRVMGRPVSALKPVISGFYMAAAGTSDTGVLLQAMGLSVTPQTVTDISPWRFRAPLSPNMAAARENRVVDFAGLITYCRDAIASTRSTLFIEGVGGVMVPLDSYHTVLEWIAALEIPVFLVAGTYLGTISHTLTALHALQSRSIGVRAIVLNESVGSTVSTGETIETIRHFAPGISLFTIPRTDDLSAMNEAFVQLCKCVK